MQDDTILRKTEEMLPNSYLKFFFLEDLCQIVFLRDSCQIFGRLEDLCQNSGTSPPGVQNDCKKRDFI